MVVKTDSGTRIVTTTIVDMYPVMINRHLVTTTIVDMYPVMVNRHIVDTTIVDMNEWMNV